MALESADRRPRRIDRVRMQLNAPIWCSSFFLSSSSPPIDRLRRDAMLGSAAYARTGRVFFHRVRLCQHLRLSGGKNSLSIYKKLRRRRVTLGISARSKRPPSRLSDRLSSVMPLSGYKLIMTCVSSGIRH